ncbi:MAG: FAD-dependent monooxygenase [Haloarculaceae archaeon]
MTLADIDRYDGDRVARAGEHAVVVGGSVAGLLAGRVLADGFDRVTVLDRDPVPDGPVARRSVPQAPHVHTMLEPGRAVLSDCFPGYADDLVGAGGLVIDAATDLDYYHRGDFVAEGPDRLPMYCASRPLFEHLVRRRLADRGDVTLRGGHEATGYLTDDGSRVTGVRVTVGGNGGRDDSDGDEDGARASETELAADLVVDATGRTSRTPAWLDANGYRPPPESEVTVDLAYSTVTVERPSEARRGVLVVPSPSLARGGTAVPVEDDRWTVTLFGLHGDHPPTDPEGLRAFARRLPAPDIADLLADHGWVSGVSHYPFRSSLRRRYEALDRFPSGLVVTGDALASFNPIYGQGMSVAALDAVHLHHALADGLTGVGPRFFRRASGTLDTVWRLTVGADFEFPGTTGPKPRGTDLVNRYVARVVETAHDDPLVADRFARVLRLERAPESLFAPGVLWRVLAPEAVRRRG